MPENPISHVIYRYVRKRLEKIKMDEYSNEFSKWVSVACKHAVLLIIRGVKRLAAYVNSHDIEAVENKIEELKNVLKHKKSAVNLRGQVGKSEIIKDELNDSEISTSMLEEDEPVAKPHQNKPVPHHTDTSAGMGRILVDMDDDLEERGRIRLTGNSGIT
jgi:hypothetical protein